MTEEEKKIKSLQIRVNQDKSHKESDEEILDNISLETITNTKLSPTFELSPFVESSLSAYLRKINNIPSLSQEEEFLLAKAYIEQQDITAAHKLSTSHLKLVAKIALSYKNYNIPTLDLISEGNIGLLYAIKKYNPSLGHRLSTYAMWWIKAMIQDYILKSWSLVRIVTTAQQKKLFFALRKLKRKIAKTHMNISQEEYEQISRELQINTSEVIAMDNRISYNDLSLNQQKNSDEESPELLDLLPEKRLNQEITLINKEDAQRKYQILRFAMEKLETRERYVLRMRKFTEDPVTLKTLSEELNISKERVRQIENQAMIKLKQNVLLLDKVDTEIKLLT